MWHTGLHYMTSQYLEHLVNYWYRQHTFGIRHPYCSKVHCYLEALQLAVKIAHFCSPHTAQSCTNTHITCVEFGISWLDVSKKNFIYIAPNKVPYINNRREWKKYPLNMEITNTKKNKKQSNFKLNNKNTFKRSVHTQTIASKF